VPTSIPGLDTVLRGGFSKQALTSSKGAPGTGKTILANQFCFNHSLRAPCGVRDADVGNALSMIQHMQMMRFFDPARIPDALYYVNAFRTLEEDGLKRLFDLTR
jgi:circadian clock protein KaiC